MDLRSLALDLPHRRARLGLADAAGERVLTVAGEGYGRLEEAAAGLLAGLEARLGGACHLGLEALRLDAVARELTCVLDGGEERRFAGAEWVALERGIVTLARAAISEARPDRPELAESPSEAAFWSRLYAGGFDGFELGRAAPPLERWFRAQSPAGLAALNLGCGRGHDARMLARAGARVTAVDFVPEMIAEARTLAEREGVAVDFLVRDLFTLPEQPARYDLVVEHCCFCAIEPRRRAEWVAVAASVLRPGGQLVGLFRTHGRPGGPPYTVSRAELEELLRPRFTVAHVETPPDSVAARAGEELLLLARLAT